MQVPPGDGLQPEATGATVEATKWLKPSVKRVTTYGDSASVQADPTQLSGKADTSVGESKQYRQLLHRGMGDSMYTRKAQATREALRRVQG